MLQSKYVHVPLRDPPPMEKKVGGARDSDVENIDTKPNPSVTTASQDGASIVLTREHNHMRDEGEDVYTNCFAYAQKT